MKKGSSQTSSYDVDRMMRNVALSLIRDFRDTFDDHLFCSDLNEAIRSRDVAKIREVCSAPIQETDTARFKAAYQLQSVFKRYRFSKDLFSDSELVDRAITSFCETQDRIRNTDLDHLTAKYQVILDLARVYIANVLGEYNDEEHRNLCRFGNKASVGIPARAACLAARWEPPISGSLEQISWFDSEMGQEPQILDYWKMRKGSDQDKATYQETSSLKLTLVPKTFKSLRAIMPNTTIGSYMSYGLGEMIRKRLKRNGYDIKTLQMRHRYLARQGSIHGLYTTADLSSASDSISVALVNRLFPRDWCDILHRSRIGQVVLPDGSVVLSQTFCTMGIGYTFPLQTLVFLALLHAIQAYNFGKYDRRLISVYGDDMIYSHRMHEFVVDTFGHLGFVINVDKTYNEGWFRESCGGDYYHGVDVRPFQPRNGSASVSRRTYEAILYKYINGLLMRWSEYEIGTTLNYLLSEVEFVTGKAKIVPSDFPDDAGIKCSSVMLPDFLKHTNVSRPKSVGHGMFRFSYLSLKTKVRKENRHGPYLWSRLRGDDPQTLYEFGWIHSRQRDPRLVTLIKKYTGQDTERVSSLIVLDDKPIRLFRSISGRRLRRNSTYVTISHTGQYVRQSGTSRFEDRR